MKTNVLRWKDWARDAILEPRTRECEWRTNSTQKTDAGGGNSSKTLKDNTTFFPGPLCREERGGGRGNEGGVGEEDTTQVICQASFRNKYKIE